MDATQGVQRVCRSPYLLLKIGNKVKKRLHIACHKGPMGLYNLDVAFRQQRKQFTHSFRGIVHNWNHIDDKLFERHKTSSLINTDQKNCSPVHICGAHNTLDHILLLMPVFDVT